MSTAHSSVDSFYDTASTLRHCFSRNENPTQCFCGRRALRSSNDEDGDAESIIYCSAECARQDALAALTYNRIKEGELLEFETPSTSSSIASIPQPVQMAQDEDWQDNAKRAGLALQRSINETPASHYRRMELAAQEEYAFDMMNELIDESESRSSSPSSTTSSSDSVDTAQATEASSPNDVKKNVRQTHIISLPETPLLDLDDQETELQRKRQEAIEREIAELDMSLRKELDAFDAHNDLLRMRSSKFFDEDGDSCFESDLVCGLRSPMIDYESPLGWRRGGSKVLSTNFLGLQLNSHLMPDDCADEEADKARMQRLQDALDQSFGELTTSMESKDALHLSRIPSHPLAKLQTSNVQFINPFQLPTTSSAPSMLRSSSNESTATTRRRAPKSPARVSMRVPDRKSSLPLLTAPQLFVAPEEKHNSPRGRLISFPSKQNLSNFFLRRPSHSALMNGSGIGSADLALTPHQIRSAPPRYIPLPRSLRS